MYNKLISTRNEPNITITNSTGEEVNKETIIKLAKRLAEEPKDINLFLACNEILQTEILGIMFEEHAKKSVEKLLFEIANKLNRKIEKNNTVVLASSSPRRKYLLTKMGINYLTDSSNTNEYQPRFAKNPETITNTIATLKLLSFLQRNSIKGNLIITSDTLVHLEDGPILGKPQGKTKIGQINDARNTFLNILPGKKCIVSSTIIMFNAQGNKITIGDDKTEIKFKKLDDSYKYLIDHYLNLAFDEKNPGRGPLGKAGGFGIQEPEILQIIEYIKGDPFVVVGISINETKKMLEESGMTVADIDNKQMYESLWGGNIWAGQKYFISLDTDLKNDGNFMELALSKISKLF